MRGGHLQTLLGHFIPSPEVQSGERVEVTLPDQDKMVGFYHPGDVDVLVYLFHGLGGHAGRDYMARAAIMAQRRGYHVIRMNHRGCGAGRGLAKGPYHSGRAEDLAEVVRYGRQRFPDLKHVVIGFSLSGNALLLLNAGYRGSTQPDFGIAVNAPIRLDYAAIDIEQGFNRVYCQRFVRLCRQAVTERVEDGLIDGPQQMPKVMTLRRFDDLFTAPAGGFRDKQDYYDSCSAAYHISNIKVPTVMLTCEDDPFVKFKPYQELDLPEMVHLHVERHGGHMGYLTRRTTPVSDRRWLDYALDQWLGAWHGECTI